MKNIIQKIVLAGIVCENNKILILQRHMAEKVFPGMWELPSGKREPLEPSVDALIREVFEETGVKVVPVAPVSLFDYQIEKESEIRDSTQINYLVRPVEKKFQVHISSEHQAYEWIGEIDMAGYNLSESTKETIKKSFEVLRLLKK